jgi:hypothetical protein
MVGVARKHGVVKDRLRLKDATHVIANIVVPATMALVGSCMGKAPKRYGRTVCMSDYQEAHRRAREKTKTPEYTEIRREPWKVERTLGEVVRCSGICAMLVFQPSRRTGGEPDGRERLSPPLF